MHHVIYVINLDFLNKINDLFSTTVFKIHLVQIAYGTGVNLIGSASLCNAVKTSIAEKLP